MADGNYVETMKCFLNALKMEPENQQILRDLSWAQVQIDDFDGFVESRHKLLTHRPGLKLNWVRELV